MTTLSIFDNIDAHKTTTEQCLVLDLDETLVHTIGDREKDVYGITQKSDYADLRHRTFILDLIDPVTNKGTGHALQLWGVTRPHLRPFLIFAASHFKVVAVWSAGRDRYVREAVRQVFAGIAPNFPPIVYTYDDLPVDDRTDKPLRKMIEENPIAQRYMNLQNTFIVDDRDTAYNRSNPGNGILIPPYEPYNRPENLRSDDTALLQLAWWFNQPEVKASKDVRKLNKANIFTQSAQTWQRRSLYDINNRTAQTSYAYLDNSPSFTMQPLELSGGLPYLDTVPIYA